MKIIKYIIPLLFCSTLAYGGTPLDSTPVNMGLAKMLNSEGVFKTVYMADGTSFSTTPGGTTFNGGTITSNLQVVGSITANALAVPPSVTTVTFGATSTVSVANVNTPQMFRLTLTGTTTIVFDTVGTGTFFSLWVVQDATGTRTVQWGTSTSRFSGGTKPTLSSTPNAIDILSLQGYNNVAHNVSFAPDVK